MTTPNQPSSWRPRLPVALLAVLLTAYYLIVFNHTMWHRLWSFTASGEDISVEFFAVLCVIIFVYVHLVMTLLLWPRFSKFILCLLLPTSALAAYFVDAYHVFINPDMLINVFQTNPAEAISYFTPGLAINFLLAGVLPAIVIVCCRITYPVWWRHLIYKALVIFISLAIAAVAYTQYKKDYVFFDYNHSNLRETLVPYNYLNSLIQLAKNTVEKEDIPLQPLGTDAHFANTKAKQANKLVVLVLGETARAQNFGLQGYERPTTPLLAARNDIHYFPDAHSCGTVTFISVPCMFSRMGRSHYDRVKIENTDNILDILQRAGVAINWIDNDSGCKDVCNRVPHQNITGSTIPGLCKDGSCYDAILLRGLDERLRKLGKPGLLVLHQKGSHGPTYYKRYPDRFRQFTPTCNTPALQNCSYQKIVNTYDNTLLYTDYILNEVIKRLEKLPDSMQVGMIYLSDHGESLGEDGFFLHAADYATAPSQQTHIPMLMWFSDSWQAANPTSVACVSHYTQQRVTQDNLFDTLLGLFNVDTKVYRPKGDLTICQDSA